MSEPNERSAEQSCRECQHRGEWKAGYARGGDPGYVYSECMFDPIPVWWAERGERPIISPRAGSHCLTFVRGPRRSLADAEYESWIERLNAASQTLASASRKAHTSGFRTSDEAAPMCVVSVPRGSYLEAALESAKRAKPEAQPALDGAEAAKQDDPRPHRGPGSGSGWGKTGVVQGEG